MSLKDSVIGRTDEVGVQLPPLHPRCRCTIQYRELTLNFNPQRFGGQKIPEGDYNLTKKTVAQACHLEGTREYQEYTAKLSEKNLMPSKMAASTDAQALVNEFHGKGICDPNPRDGSVRERVDTGKIVGQYWDRQAQVYVDTTWPEIVYSKRGTHVYPNRPPKED